MAIWVRSAELRHEITVTEATLTQAFAQAALVTLGLGMGPTTVTESEQREVRAHGATPEELLAHWIAECLYVQDIEGFACAAIEFTVFDVEPKAGAEPLRLHAVLRGEPDAGGGRDRAGSISPRDVVIHRVGESYEVRLVLEA